MTGKDDWDNYLIIILSDQGRRYRAFLYLLKQENG